MLENRLSRRALLLGSAAALVSTPRLWAVESRSSRGSAEVLQRLDGIERRIGGRLGVTAIDTADGRRIDYRAGERFPMCSTFKLPLVALILSRIDARREQADRFVRYADADLLDHAPITRQHLRDGGMSIAALCAAAITYSDNTAANVLLQTSGGPPALNAFLRSLGDATSHLDRIEPALNSAEPGDERDTTAPAAMLGTMQAILLGPALSAESRQQLQDWLLGNTTGDARLRAGIPNTWRVGDKTGTGAHGATNDLAILWPPQPRPPILVAAYLVASAAEHTELDAALAEIGQLVCARL